jgi:hypothetical protein
MPFMQVFLIRQAGQSGVQKEVSGVMPEMPIVWMAYLVAAPVVGRHHSQDGTV